MIWFILIMLMLIAIIFYYVFQLIQVVMQLKKDVVFPLTAEEQTTIRKFPQKQIKSPTFPKQKGGLIAYALVLVFVITAFYFTWKFHPYPHVFTLYLLIMMPLFNIQNTLNLFAVTEEGILSGGRFLKWHKMKSYELQTIGINHKYYGHAKEVNDQYEIKIHTKFLSHSCIITSKETKEKLIGLFHEKGIQEKNTGERIVESLK